MLIDVIEAGFSGGFPMDDCPAGWNLGKRGHREYWPSALIRARKSLPSSSDGFFMV
jgi:hypothetical protein